jgi:NADH dehydrogenase
MIASAERGAAAGPRRNCSLAERGIHLVTGAFGFSGRYIARRLLEAGRTVRTLTNSPIRRNEFGGRIEAAPLAFDDPPRLTSSLRGVRVLYNTYWVRYRHAGATFDQAVSNSWILFQAAQDAGVERVVHVSVANASGESPFPYFRGKALVEKALRDSGLSYAILRPAVLFGRGDILINNIAWMLRRLPVFGLFGDGEYRVQPVYVDDLAKLAVALGESCERRTVDAIGPETFTYRALVELLRAAVGRATPVIHVPPRIGLIIGSCLGVLVGDVIITREEIEALMAGLLCTDSTPNGETSLSDWVRRNAAHLGTRYAGELGRRRDRVSAYGTP